MDLYKEGRAERKQINAELKLIKETIKKLRNRQVQLRKRHYELLKLDVKHQISKFEKKKRYYEAQIENDSQKGRKNSWAEEQLRYVNARLEELKADYEMDKILIA